MVVHVCNPSYTGGLQSRQKQEILLEKQLKQKKGCGPNKHKTLSSNPSTRKGKKTDREEGRKRGREGGKKTSPTSLNTFIRKAHIPSLCPSSSLSCGTEEQHF
jgi:hypothetical protein